MATFTSVINGNWNDGATWGNASPGTKGVDWPGNAGDVVNIGHTVTYNVSEANQLGQININAGGLLTFSASMNTMLTLGHQDIVINNGGELRVGASGAVIDKSCLAELIWNTTSDNAKGIDVKAGGKLTIYDDPSYFGSDFDTAGRQYFHARLGLGGYYRGGEFHQQMGQYRGGAATAGA